MDEEICRILVAFPVLTLYIINFSGGTKTYIYLHIMSFLHIDMTQVVEIFPEVRQELAHST